VNCGGHGFLDPAKRSAVRLRDGPSRQ
jgi:hypothetical protein